MNLLVAVDGSEQALETARHALRLREAGLKAEIVLATVQEPTFLYEMVLPPTSLSTSVFEKEDEIFLNGAGSSRRTASGHAIGHFDRPDWVDRRSSPSTVERRQCIAHLTFKPG